MEQHRERFQVLRNTTFAHRDGWELCPENYGKELENSRRFSLPISSSLRYDGVQLSVWVSPEGIGLKVVESVHSR